MIHGFYPAGPHIAAQKIAEGSEITAQHEFLIGCGYDEVQDLLHSLPLAECELDLLRAARAEPAGA